MPGGEAATRNRSLPPLGKLYIQPPVDVDADAVADSWLHQLTHCIETGDIDAVASLLLEGAYWRDMLALTWEFRTFQGVGPIKQFLTDQLPVAHFSTLKLMPGNAEFQQPYPDVAWIQATFSFETEVGLGTGIVRLVPTSSSAEPSGAEGWKAHTIYTNLEELKGFPERTGPHRDPVPNHGMWPEKRRREIAFGDSDPSVVVIGAGHAGLDVAARLQLLGVSTLVLEKRARVGDQWRGRYEALCLHDPVCECCEHCDSDKNTNGALISAFKGYDHMPYIPYVYTILLGRLYGDLALTVSF